MIIHPGFVGCDVSKHHLDVFDARTGVAERIANAEPEAAALAARLAQSGDFIVFEATGSYDRHLRLALAAAGVRFARVNPGRARDFAKAAGYLAKTDRIDARRLAAMGQALELGAETIVDPEREALSVLVKRRDQLVDMRAQEKTRRAEIADKKRAAAIDAHIAWLSKDIARIDLDIARLCTQSAAIAGEIALTKTAPGVGAITASVLAALLPELGRRSPRTIAALVGLAPFAADSGQWRGCRRIRGGRRRVRQALYMAALAAIRADTRFKAFYLRLRTAGKSAKLALIAVARKLLTTLNAMLRDNVAFQT
jgi:transposase